ncbi:DUF1461 domain-containing protein [Candidatus Woesearchaeota archaeon]|nr:DUF1461 domain-containing protein [Candidatus Woesearchaeota archaeon]
MASIVWASAGLLTALTLLLSVLGTFHDDAFYRCAYGQNGAFDRLGDELVWSVTENFQSYLEDEAALALFDEQQAAHLEDVKGLYRTGVGIARLLIAALAILFVALAGQAGRRDVFQRLFRRTSIIIVVLTVVLALSAMRWDWFFTRFHELLFTGNWRFGGASLMMRLWSGSFFPLAAGYVLAKNAVAAGFLLISARLISPRLTSRSA